MDSEKISEALRPIRAAYYSVVRDIALEAIKAHPEDELTRDEFCEQSISGSDWVIITYRARLVAVVTDNADAWEDTYGEADPDEPDHLKAPSPEVVAYEAMRQDVAEAMDAEIAFPSKES